MNDSLTFRAECVDHQCGTEFDDAMWAARAIEDGGDGGDIRYLVGRFEQAATSIGYRTGRRRDDVMNLFRMWVRPERVAS